MAVAESIRDRASTPLSSEAAADFLFMEARLLDERRFEEWWELFTDDGYYWVPARPDQPNPLDEVSIFYDDKDLMETRIKRLRHPRVHAQIPHTRTAHLVTNVLLEPDVPPEDERRIGETAGRVERGVRVIFEVGADEAGMLAEVRDEG